MDLSIKELKTEARKILRGRWKTVVLGFFVPFIISLFLTYVPEINSNIENEAALVMLLESVAMSFVGNMILYAFLIGVNNLIILGKRSKKKNRGFSRILFVAVSCFSKIFIPVFMLRFVFQAIDTFLTVQNAVLLYDMLFYSYMELHIYLVFTQLIRVIINALFFYFNIVYIFTPCILSLFPLIRGKDAMHMSMRMTKGIRGKLFLLELSFFGWTVLGCLAFFVGSFFAMAYETATICVLYKKISPKLSFSLKRAL